ncbi:Heterokaryon incompatibility protein [Paramyrothecium foliicola]|nr:Heterokaryon incompatibility protein [Paramyrothecium foliicola]
MTDPKVANASSKEETSQPLRAIPDSLLPKGPSNPRNFEAADKLLKPLDASKNEIRLITIIPLKGDEPNESIIRCRLEQVSLDEEYHTSHYRLPDSGSDTFEVSGTSRDSPTQDIRSEADSKEWVRLNLFLPDATLDLPSFRYTWGDYMALSYTWGDATQVEEIMVNDEALLVTQNLVDCLRTLRNKQYIKDGWKLWIDALCINQKDVFERGREVKRMFTIYNKAWTPLIWLGLASDASDEALSLVRILADQSYQGVEYVAELTHALRENPKLFGQGVWRAFYHLALRRYWGRIWVVQEASMGRQQTPVLCGEQTISWAQIARAFEFMNKTDEVINVFIRGELEEAGEEFSYDVWAAFHTAEQIQHLQKVQQGLDAVNLRGLLELTRTQKSTDPRDKIYGLLELLPKSLEASIAPDYTAPVSKVFTDFAKATIEDTGLLDVIRHRYPTDNLALPSWVPDWTVERVNETLSDSIVTYKASGDTRATLKYFGKILSCRGFKFDSFDGFGARWSKAWSAETVENSSGTENPYGDIEAVRNAIWRTMTADRDMNGEPTTDDYRNILATPALAAGAWRESDALRELISSTVFKYCQMILDGNAALQVCGQELKDFFCGSEGDSPDAIDSLRLRHAYMRVDRVANHRRFFTTSKGYLGMALETTEKSDGIYILEGCTVPVVLRDLGDGQHFEFVGECYVHGIMNGEALEGRNMEPLYLC